ncbi:alpha/beta hydrolase [soil metagenome]
MTDSLTERRRDAGPKPRIEQGRGATARTWPVAFGGHAGWLHAPAAGRASAVGVVLCAPLGRDARCAHLPMRQLAERLAAAGVTTLRYDHLGEGDSLPLEGDDDALPAWCEGVEEAVAFLRGHVNPEQVVLGGVRFGATLAALASDIADGLILLAPVIRGSAWLRELKVATAVLAPTTLNARPLDFDADGLELGRQTVASLSQLDLRDRAFGDRPILLAAQNSAVKAFGERLAEVGAAVSIEAFAGFEAMFEDSHSNQAPGALFDRVIAWTLAAFPPTSERNRGAKVNEPREAMLFPPGAVERPVTLGDGLRGVLCRPVDGDPRGPAVILCNTGGDPRAGIGGFATSAARALAQRGVASLRFDFAGLGDSQAAAGSTRSHVYETCRQADFDAAIALMTQEGAGRIVLGGVCAGGYHALHAALDNPRVDGVFAVNTVILAWRTGTSLAIGDRDDGRSTRAYLERLKDSMTWARLIAGEIDLRAVSRTLTLRVAAWWRARLATAPEAQVKARLARLSARGGRVRLVVGSADPALDMVEAQFGRGGRRFTALPGLSLRIEAGLDHGLALRASREKVQRQLLAFVDAF